MIHLPPTEKAFLDSALEEGYTYLEVMNWLTIIRDYTWSDARYALASNGYSFRSFN